MKIIIQELDIDNLEGSLEEGDYKNMKKRHGYRSRCGEGKCKVEVSDFSIASLQGMHDYLDGKKGNRSAAISRGQVKQWMELKKNPGGQTVSKLEAVASAMVEYVRTSEHRYLFQGCEDGNMVPWFVHYSKYNEPSKHSMASVKIGIKFYERGGSSRQGYGGDDGTTLTILPEDFRDKSMSDILREKGYYLETPERMESYRREIEEWTEHESMDGFQMSVSGKAFVIDGWSRRGYSPVGNDGSPAKMVVDPTGKENEETAMACKLWNGKDENEDDDEPELWELPVHPVIQMFDLNEHGHYRVHVNNMVPYNYDKDVGDKLVLEEDIKDFIEALVDYSGETFEDIVQGKSGGTIALLEGVPGVGKTLTAEVYSEVMGRPLYRVQSSQLGTNPEALEEVLGKVLERAARWGAILLIDEADVYVRARGEDIIQNAIVGVFLRVLEYYRGVLFMTTNLGTEIDDAIISRLTARLTYEMPSEANQMRLWKILGAQNGLTIVDSEVKEIVKVLPGLSGRDIKNMLKLALVIGRKRKGELIEHLKFVSQFKQAREVK